MEAEYLLSGVDRLMMKQKVMDGRVIQNRTRRWRIMTEEQTLIAFDSDSLKITLKFELV